MPSLGADMEAGRLLEWRVRPGDRVKRGDIVALVDTDKAEIEVEVWESGVVEALLVEPGVKVPVGTVLARIRGEGEAPAAGPPAPPPAPRPGERRVAPLAPRVPAERGSGGWATRGRGRLRRRRRRRPASSCASRRWRVASPRSSGSTSRSCAARVRVAR